MQAIMESRIKWRRHSQCWKEKERVREKESRQQWQWGMVVVGDGREVEERISNISLLTFLSWSQLDLFPSKWWTNANINVNTSQKWELLMSWKRIIYVIHGFRVCLCLNNTKGDNCLPIAVLFLYPFFLLRYFSLTHCAHTLLFAHVPYEIPRALHTPLPQDRKWSHNLTCDKLWVAYHLPLLGFVYIL